MGRHNAFRYEDEYARNIIGREAVSGLVSMQTFTLPVWRPALLKHCISVSPPDTGNDVLLLISCSTELCTLPRARKC
jgi:hypothetical protein